MAETNVVGVIRAWGSTAHPNAFSLWKKGLWVICGNPRVTYP